MSGRELYEDYVAQDKNDDEKSFDQIVAQTLEDQKFLEENTQLPGDVGPQPPAAPAPPPVERGQRPAPGMGEGGLQANAPIETTPAPSPEFTYENIVLPPTSESPMTQGLQDWLATDSDLAKQLEGERQTFDYYDQSIEQILGLDMQQGGLTHEGLTSITPSGLDLFYQNIGIEPTGPIAGLNSELANINVTIKNLEDEYLSYDRGQIVLVGTEEEKKAYADVSSQLEGAYKARERLIGNYFDTVDEVVAGFSESSEKLLGEGGLQEQYNSLVSGAERMSGMDGADIQFTDDMVSYLANFSNDAQTIPEMLSQADRIEQANEEARKRYRDQAETYAYGAPLREFSATGEFRDDPGFQEFMNQLTTADVSQETLDQVNRGLPPDMQIDQIAARENPYGVGPPVPLQTNLVDIGSEYRQQTSGGVPGLDTLVGGVTSISDMVSSQLPSNDTLDMLAKGAALGSSAVPGGPLVGLTPTALLSDRVQGIAGAEGRLALQGLDVLEQGSHIAAAETFTAGGELYDYLNAIHSEVMSGFNTEEGMAAFQEKYWDDPNSRRAALRAQGGYTGHVLPDLGTAAKRVKAGIEYDVSSYEKMPWYVRGAGLAAEVTFLDPTNLIPGVSAFKRFRAGTKLALASRDAEKFRGTMKLALDDIADSSLKIDRDYELAAQHLTTSNITIQDSYKYGAGQSEFYTAAKSAFPKMPDTELKIFSNRVATRFGYEQNPEWGRILNEETRRLTDRNGLSLDEVQTGKLNDALREHVKFDELKGNEFWANQGTFPTVLHYDPATSKNPYSAYNRLIDPAQETDLVGIGHGPDALLNERYADDMAISGASSSADPDNQMAYRYLTAIGEDAPVSQEIGDGNLEMLRYFAEKNQKPLAKDPENYNEFRHMLIEVTGTGKDHFNWIPATTFDDIARNPAYRELVGKMESGRTLGRYPDWVDKPASKGQLAFLMTSSIKHNQDYLAQLVAREGVGPMASSQRAQHILSNIKLTPDEKVEIVNAFNTKGRMSKKAFKPMTTADLENTTFKEGKTLLRSLTGAVDKARDAHSVGMHFLNNSFEARTLVQESNAKQELALVLRDLMTDIRSTRFPTTRPSILPDGTTVNGYVRMSPNQMMEALRTAPESIRGLENYGPFIDEMTAAIGNFPGKNVDELRDVIGEVPSVLHADIQARLDLFLDDAVMNAPLHETEMFMKWVNDLYTKGARKLPSDVKRITTAGDLIHAPVNRRSVFLRKGMVDINVRNAYRASLLEQRNAYNAMVDLTSYEVKGEVRSLNFNRLSRLKDRDAAVKELAAHFNHKDSPMSLKEFHEYVRQIRAVQPGGATFADPRTGKAIIEDEVPLKKLLGHYGAVEDAIRNIDNEIADLQVGVDKLADQLGVDISYANYEDQIATMEEFATRFQQRFPEYATYTGNYATPGTTPAVRKQLAVDSSLDIAKLAESSTKSANDHTLRIANLDFTVDPESGTAFGARHTWGPDAQQRLADEIKIYNADSANPIAFQELARHSTPEGFIVDENDYVTQALLMRSQTDAELAKKAGISIKSAERARTASSRALGEVTAAHSQTIASDARKLNSAIEKIAPFVAESGTDGVSITNGIIEIADRARKGWLDYLEDQQKLSLISPGPGRTTKAAAEKTRAGLEHLVKSAAGGGNRAQFDMEYIDPLLGVVKFSVPSGSPLSSQVLRVFGDEGKRFIKPRSQRPVVNTFDPYINHHRDIDWGIHGKAYDRLTNLYHDYDEVWGEPVRKKVSVRGLNELTRGAKGIALGGHIEFVAHRVMSNVADLARASGNPLSDPYSDILNVMDDIVAGAPSANATYGEMFSSSEEMGRALKWLRTEFTYKGITRSGWEHMKADWGAMTPHLSFARMPSYLTDILFRPMRSGLGIRGKQLGNRAPVLDDLDTLKQFIFNTDVRKIEGLTDTERQQTLIWQGHLRDVWKQGAGKRFQEALENDDFRRGWHIDDLDELFGLDAKDPYDYQRFGSNMGMLATELEHARLGYDPSDIPAIFRVQQGIKSVFGLFWLRLSPRYIINNIFGNYSSIALNGVRRDRAGGAMRDMRILQSLGKEYSSLSEPSMLSMGIAGSELRGFTTQTAIERASSQYASDLARSRTVRRTPEEAAAYLREKGATKRGIIGSTSDAVRRPIDTLSSWQRNLTDFFEIDARQRVWSNEFNAQFTDYWGKTVDRVPGLDDDLKNTLKGHLELADIAKTFEANSVPASVRQELVSGYNTAISNGHLRAYEATKDVMRDYLARNRFDHYMDAIFPYHYWMTKNLMFVTGTVLDRPSTILQASQIYDTWSVQWEKLPSAAKMKIVNIKVPESIPGIGGKDVWLRPNNMTNPAFFIFPAVVEELRNAWERNEKTSLLPRIARTFAGGSYKAWEEAGYQPGPQWDVANYALGRSIGEGVQAFSSDENAAWWLNHYNNAYGKVFRPSGFGQSLLPLGGLENLLLQPKSGAMKGAQFWRIGDRDASWIPYVGNKAETWRGVMAWANQTIKGTSYTRYQMVGMTNILADMTVNGELGVEFTEVTNPDGTVTYNYSRGDLTKLQMTYSRLNELIKSGDFQALENDPVGKEMLDRFYTQQGNKSGVNYFTSLSATEFTNEWKNSFEATQMYSMLVDQDAFIPVPPKSNTATRALIAGMNSQIAEAVEEQEHALEINNYSPSAIADATDKYLDAVNKIYDEAEDAGLMVPRRQDEGPSNASRAMWGEYNPQTGLMEGARAPWIQFYWGANDSFDEATRVYNETSHYSRVGSEIELNKNIWAARDRRYGKTAPYFNQIDDSAGVRDADLARLYGQNLPANQQLIREDEILRAHDARVRGIFAQAEKDGVSLKGSGNPPSQTPAWWRATEAAGGDLKYLYERAGIVPANGDPLMGIDEMLRKDQVENQKKAHTDWAIEHLIEITDFSPYLEGGGWNPRFVSSRENADGEVSRFLDLDLWEREMQAAAPDLVKQYTAILNRFNQDDPLNENRIDLIANPDIRFKDILAFAKEEMLPQQTAYEQAFYAMTDRYYKAPKEEKQSIIEQGVSQFGPRFGEVVRQQTVKIDTDGIASALTEFRKTIKRPQEREVFDSEYGHMFTDVDGEMVALPENVVYRDAVAAAQSFGIKIPTLYENAQETRAKQAINDLWNNPLIRDANKIGSDSTAEERRNASILSNAERSRIKEELLADGTLPDDLFLTLSNRDEDGEVYTFDVLNLEALTDPEDIKKVLNKLNLGVPLAEGESLKGALFREQLFPEENETVGVASSRDPDFNKMMARAVEDKRYEVTRDMFANGEAFLKSEEDINNYQRIQAFKQSEPELYDAGRKFIDEQGVSWEWLAETLEAPTKAAGDSQMTLQEFAEAYVGLLDEVDASRLYNDRRYWLHSEEGQDAYAHDPAYYRNYLDDRNPLAEDFKMQARSGELYGFEGEDLKNWTDFYEYIDQWDHLYAAAQDIRDQNGWTWKELIANLDEGPIRIFAEGYQQRITDNGMSELWDRRADFWKTKYGQSIIALDSEDLARNISGGGSSGGGSGSNFGGNSSTYSGSSGGGYRSGGFTSNASPSTGDRSINDFYSPIRDIFRLDTAMSTGGTADAQSRFDVAIQIGDIIQQRLQPLIDLFGEDDDFVKLLAQTWVRWLKDMFGESPTLDMWMQALDQLGVGPKPAVPSQELLAQPGVPTPDLV